MTLELEPGDRLVLYTDGVTEAEDPATASTARPGSAPGCRPTASSPRRVLIDGVIAEVLEHCGTARPRDDMTLMCLDYEPAS